MNDLTKIIGGALIAAAVAAIILANQNKARIDTIEESIKGLWEYVVTKGPK